MNLPGLYKRLLQKKWQLSQIEEYVLISSVGGEIVLCKTVEYFWISIVTRHMQ